MSVVGINALLLSAPYRAVMTHCFNNKITSVYLKGVLFLLKASKCYSCCLTAGGIVSGAFCV